EVGGQRGQPIIGAIRPSIFDRDDLALDTAAFAESLAEGGENGCAPAGRKAVQEADHRRRLLLLCSRHKRQREHHAAKQDDQIAPSHRLFPLTALIGQKAPVRQQGFRLRLQRRYTGVGRNAPCPPRRSNASWPRSSPPTSPATAG